LTFADHLNANNSAGLDAIWNRTLETDRPRLLTDIFERPAHSEAHVFLASLIDRTLPEPEQLERLRTGIEALSDLASTRSSDRGERLRKWAHVAHVREALLELAAVRGERASNELIDWLASADDDALTDALIPIFLKAVEQRDGARLARLGEMTRHTHRLMGVSTRYEALKKESKQEWLEFVESLGIAREPPFSLRSTFRGADPSVVLTVDPRRLNWFSCRVGTVVYDSTRVALGEPFLGGPRLFEIPRRLHAYLRQYNLKGKFATDVLGSEAARARVRSWLLEGKKV
jgi:hypothetical protein